VVGNTSVLGLVVWFVGTLQNSLIFLEQKAVLGGGLCV